LLSSTHERFPIVGDITQKFRRSFEIPVRGVDVDVAHIGRQGDHMLANAISVRWAILQCPHSECVTKAVPTRTATTSRGGQASFPRQPFERALDGLVPKGLTATTDEHMVAAWSGLVTVREVAPQARCCRLVQWNQASFPELGISDQ